MLFLSVGNALQKLSFRVPLYRASFFVILLSEQKLLQEYEHGDEGDAAAGGGDDDGRRRVGAALREGRCRRDLAVAADYAILPCDADAVLRRLFQHLVDDEDVLRGGGGLAVCGLEAAIGAVDVTRVALRGAGCLARTADFGRCVVAILAHMLDASADGAGVLLQGARNGRPLAEGVSACPRGVRSSLDYLVADGAGEITRVALRTAGRIDSSDELEGGVRTFLVLVFDSETDRAGMLVLRSRDLYPLAEGVISCFRYNASRGYPRLAYGAVDVTRVAVGGAGGALRALRLCFCVRAALVLVFYGVAYRAHSLVSRSRDESPFTEDVIARRR